MASIEHHLPGEHGFRFFPGFYKHVIDTMRRIPSFDGRKVADHLVPTTRVGITQYGKPTFLIPAVFPRTPGDAGTVLRDILLAFGPITDLTPDDLAFFGARIWQILTSCEQRRLGEYERTSWWEFVGAEQRSASYQKFLAAGITRSLVAAKARKASTRTIGDVFVQLMLTIVNPIAGCDGSRPRRADESRLDRSLARLSRVDAACSTVRGGGRGDPVRQGTGHRRGGSSTREAHGRQGRPLRGRAPARAHGPSGGQPTARRRPDTRQSAHARAERRVDERHAVLSAAATCLPRMGT